MDTLLTSSSNSLPPPMPQRARPASRLPLLLLLLLGVIVLAFVPELMERIQYSRTRGEVRALREALPGLELKPLSQAFSLVYRAVKPSVVHINTRRELIAAVGRRGSPIGGPAESFEQQGQGSGVIVDAAGYIVTNFHVVESASNIEATLDDGRTFVADVVGVDPANDIAVLKINATGLVAATWGDSDKLEVGEMVWAIGNPYGLDQTVTSGIVSAKGRGGFANSPYKDFLQTDVAINPGSSGGPLVDVRGDVVGINFAIFGRGYQGISFAIPSNLAKEVYDKIRAEVRMVRGYLGVGLLTLTPEVAAAFQFPRDLTAGAVVTTVTRGSPAEKAGIEPRDVILEWNGQPVNDHKELMLLVARTPVGATIPVKVWHEGRQLTLDVTVLERPAQLQ